MPEAREPVIGRRPRFRPRGAPGPDPGPIEITVERIGAAGDGIGRHNGQPVYLPFTVPGDRVRARLGPRRGGGHSARVVDFVTAGPARSAPPCRHFGTCGGCALQHLDPAFYRRTKLDALLLTLARAHVEPGDLAPLESVPPTRRRTRLGLAHLDDARKRVCVGFRGRFRHSLVNIDECPVLEPPLLAAVAGLRETAALFLAPGEAAETVLTRTDSGIDLLIEAAARPTLGASEALAAFAAAADVARVVWRCHGADYPIVERRPVRVLFAGIAVPFPPGAFLQASAAAERLLVGEVLAGIGGRRPALDLFAGLGAFAFALAAGGRIHAVDIDKVAIAALADAARGGSAPITAECRDLAHEPLPPEALAGYRAAVFDPPRAGAAAQASALAAADLDTVVAVSCNPKTFARDAAILKKGGFRLERLMPIDQFVWTPHLELVGLFRR